MIRRLINSLRRKPKAVRDNIALSVAGGATAVVALAWVLITPGNIATVVSDVDAAPGAFSTLFEQFRNQTAAVSDSLDTIRENTEEIESESENVVTGNNDDFASTTPTSTPTVIEASSTARTVRIATTTLPSSE